MDETKRTILTARALIAGYVLMLLLALINYEFVTGASAAFICASIHIILSRFGWHTLQIVMWILTLSTISAYVFTVTGIAFLAYGIVLTIHWFNFVNHFVKDGTERSFNRR